MKNHLAFFVVLCAMISVLIPRVVAQSGVQFQESFEWISPPPYWTFEVDPAPGVAIYSFQASPQAYKVNGQSEEAPKGLIIGVEEAVSAPRVVAAGLTLRLDSLPQSLELRYQNLGTLQHSEDGVYVSVDNGATYNLVLRLASRPGQGWVTEEVNLSELDVIRSMIFPSSLIFKFQKVVSAPIVSLEGGPRDGLWIERVTLRSGSFSESASVQKSKSSLSALIFRPERRYHFLEGPVAPLDSTLLPTDPDILSAPLASVPNLPLDTLEPAAKSVIMQLPVSGWDVDQANAVARRVRFSELTASRFELVEGPTLDTLIAVHDDPFTPILDFVLAAAKERGATYVYHAHVDTVIVKPLTDAAGNTVNIDLHLNLTQHLLRVSDGKQFRLLAIEQTNTNSALRMANGLATLTSAVASTSNNAAVSEMGREALAVQMRGNDLASSLGDTDLVPKLSKLLKKIEGSPSTFMAKAICIQGEIYTIQPYRKPPLLKGYEIEIGLGAAHGLKVAESLMAAAASNLGRDESADSGQTAKVKFVVPESGTLLGVGKVVRVDAQSATVRITQNEATRLITAYGADQAKVRVMPQ